MVYKIRVKQNWLSDFLFGTLEKLRQKNRKGWNKKNPTPSKSNKHREKQQEKQNMLRY